MEDVCKYESVCCQYTPNLQIFFSALQINCKTPSLALRLPLIETSFVFSCQMCYRTVFLITQGQRTILNKSPTN